MKDDLIQLPNVDEVKEMLGLAKNDIQNELKQDPELKQTSELLVELINIIETKIGSNKDLSKLGLKEKIDMAAHLNFLQILLEDFFMLDDDFDFSDEEEECEECDEEHEK